MRFYKDKNGNLYYWHKIIKYKLTAIHCDRSIRFLKNGEFHNSKNLAFIGYDSYEQFNLYGELYDNEGKFTKESWRRFVKLQVFK